MTELDPGPIKAAAHAGFWEQVLAADCAVPADARLDDLTVELVELLGADDPHLRDELARVVLCTWIDRGVHDDLLPGLGDGLAEGLRLGLGETGTTSVLRRSFSAAALGRVIERDTVRPRVPREVALAWGDRGLAWLLAERDLRGHVPGAGRAQAMRHGADLVGALARSRHLDEGGLVVLLDTVADRLLSPTTATFSAREEDRFALAVMGLLSRDVVDLALLEQWLDRLGGVWAQVGLPGEPIPAHALNTVAFLRALHLAVLLGVPELPGAGRGPASRVELLGLLAGALRRTGPFRVEP